MLNCRKVLAMFKNLSKTSWIGDPDVDDFKNLISSSLTTDTSVVNCREDPFSSFYVKMLTDGQTDRQTDRQTADIT